MQESLKTDTGAKKLETVLEEEGELFSAASGISMLPCIRPGKDLLYLKCIQKRPEPYDVILYRRKNGACILHRVLEVRENGYVLCGDSQYIREYGIGDSQIMGVLQGFYRGKRYIDCKSSKVYSLYVKIWCSSLWLRKWLLRFGFLVKRGLEKCRKI